jgi:hypothetical protein
MLYNRRQDYYDSKKLTVLMTSFIRPLRGVFKKFGVSVSIDWAHFPTYGEDCYCIYIPVASMLGATGLESIQDAVTNLYFQDHDARVCIIPFFNDRPVENIDFNEDIYHIINHFIYMVRYHKETLLKAIATHLSIENVTLE